MTTVATVRVRSDTPSDKGGRPKRADLEKAAGLLKERGFLIKRIGRFGVSIEGDDETFDRELGMKLAKGKSFVGKPHPELEQLERLIDLIEVTSEPEYY